MMILILSTSNIVLGSPKSLGLHAARTVSTDGKRVDADLRARPPASWTRRVLMAAGDASFSAFADYFAACATTGCGERAEC